MSLEHGLEPQPTHVPRLNEYGEWVPGTPAPTAEPERPVTPPTPPAATNPPGPPSQPPPPPAGPDGQELQGDTDGQPRSALPESTGAPPPTLAQRIDTGLPFILVGAVVLILLVVFGVSGMLRTIQQPDQPTAAPATSTSSILVADGGSPTATSPEPTPATPIATTDPVEVKRAFFTLGLEHYGNKQWAAAAEAFEQVFAIDPDYAPTTALRDVLTAALYNQSIGEINGALSTEIKDVEAIRAHFARIATIIDGASTDNPTLQSTYQDRRDRAAEWGNILDSYLAGRAQIKEESWEAAITTLEAIPLSREDYGASVRILDVAKQRAAAYMGYGAQLAAAGSYEEARAQYEQASALADAGADISPAQTAIAALPPPTARPTVIPVIPPTAVPLKLRVSVANYNDDPTCISLGVRGTNTSGWSFSVDGIGIRGAIDTAGNGRICGLGRYQEVTISIFNASGRVVSGGSGVPSRGSAIMVATWR